MLSILRMSTVDYIGTSHPPNLEEEHLLEKLRMQLGLEEGEREKMLLSAI